MQIVTRNPNFIFIHNPKAGGRYLYAELRHDLDQNTGIETLPPYYGTHITLKNLENERLFKEFIGNSYSDTIVMSVIRNPWARLWSFYKFILASTAERITRRLSGEEVKNSIDDETDQRVLQEMQSLSFPDWVLQTRNTSFAFSQHIPPIDQVSYLETELKYKEIVYLQYEAIGTEDHPSLKNIGINLAEYDFARNASSDYREHYHQEAREFVEHHFHRDIEMFKYEF